MEALKTTVMSMNRATLSLVAMCAVVVLLSLAGLLWAVLAGIALTLDGILLVLTCLTMGGVFSLMLLLLIKEHNWHRYLFKAKPSSDAANPSAPPTTTPPSSRATPPAGSTSPRPAPPRPPDPDSSSGEGN